MTTNRKLDDAARAAWLYYVAGNTQDQIATKLGVSRQSAQRLVSLAVAEGLVKVRIDHPIANCLDLARQLVARFGLTYCDVAPTDPEATSSTIGIAELGAAEMERWLRRSEPIVIAIGTGRSLRAAVEQLPRIDCPQHKVVSLTGNISPDGSAAFYNVIFSMTDRITARAFPMPLPVIASSAEERDMLRAQPMIRRTVEMASRADVAFVGIGELDDDAPLVMDGFLTPGDVARLRDAGAVGEIFGWAFDAEGKLAGSINERVASSPIPDVGRTSVIAIAKGPRKLPGIAAAIRGHLVNGLITDEATAQALLNQE